MKKMLRIAAALAALLAMTNFIGCKNDDDEESGNGLENTYWAMEDFSLDVVENVSLTFKNVGYVHIEDSSKGSVYAADVESLDYSTMDLTKTNSVDISYSSEKQSFTYVVEGSKITVTSKYTDDDGKEKTEIIEGTLAADKKSFTTKYTDDDGKEVSETYTRIDKAPAKATLVITVADSDVAVTEVKITSTVTEVTAGETITLTAEVSPADATNKTVTWTSSNESVATVDSTGKVTGVVAGTAKITAKAGEKTATVEVTVKAAATSGGETGTTTGFENTYWVLEKTSFEESGLKVTLENLEYIYIKDSTSGSSYAANPEGVIKGLSESSVGTHNLDYEEPITFTYTVDGSNVTIKVGEETITAVIAADKNSFSTTDGSTATTYTYTKVAAAPTQATVTVEATAAPSTGVNAAWDFNVASLTAAGLTTSQAKPAADKEIAVTSGSGATLTLLAQNGKSLKIQNAETGGLNVGAGSTETEVLSITVEKACTLKFKCKGSSGSTFSTTKPNSFSVNGTKVYERASADETAYQDFTYPITEAGTYKIAASGMIFTALTCE